MRIGIDFDNTMICYDAVFCDLAKAQRLVQPDYQGNKRELRDAIRTLPDGDLIWQRLQGKVYGEFIQKAIPFAGFKEFIAECNRHKEIEIFIVSHKTELGHFDEKHINLRIAAMRWLKEQGFFQGKIPYLLEENIFFEATREEKIARIQSLGCTHFIDDLIEVFTSPSFPKIACFLFQPMTEGFIEKSLTCYTNWADIKNALFAN